jgi:cytochrome oxidase Cu insertion factor (SCO1/SenC/PrrC family)
MRAFLQSYPRFTGLTGSRQQIDRIKKAFRVFRNEWMISPATETTQFRTPR